MNETTETLITRACGFYSAASEVSTIIRGYPFKTLDKTDQDFDITMKVGKPGSGVEYVHRKISNTRFKKMK